MRPVEARVAARRTRRCFRRSTIWGFRCGCWGTWMRRRRRVSGRRKFRRGREWRGHANSREAGRRLKVGYVSPDFRDHPVGRFMVPLVAGHDAAAVEVFCYADEVGVDGVTAAIKRHAAQWRGITGMGDAAV